MPAAAFVPLIIQGVGAGISAYKQHHAAGQAAKQEVAAGERARQDLAPYTSAGGQAANSLASLSGLAPSGPGGPVAAPMGTQMQTAPVAASAPGGPPAASTGYRTPQPGANSFAAMATPTGGQAPNASSYGPVPMRHPQTGQIHMVSPDQVQAAMADGGQVVQ